MGVYNNHLLKTVGVGLGGMVDVMIPGPIHSISAAAVAPEGHKTQAATRATTDSQLARLPGYGTLAYMARKDLKT